MIADDNVESFLFFGEKWESWNKSYFLTIDDSLVDGLA